ncbi:MAG: DUF4465 domain-containing protein [Bacteroidia bacterium]
MKIKILTLLIFAGFNAVAQTANFESLILAPESYWAGQDGTANYFEQSDFYFPSNWDTSFGGYWLSGWAYSNMTDSSTSGYENQFSAKPGSGHNQSSNYAVALDNGYFLVNGWQYNSPEYMWITNTTYAHNSMRDGDGFAKKFGGMDGNDPDYFYVEFRAFYHGLPAGDSVQVFLADFRSADNSEDYILNEWTAVDLSPLGLNTLDVDSVAYTFHSSDTGEFGINTPKYFCIDDLGFNASVNSTKELLQNRALLYPNPAHGFFCIKGKEAGTIKYSIFNYSGDIVQNGVAKNNEIISTSNLAQGAYFIELNTGFEKEYHKLIIQ